MKSFNNYINGKEVAAQDGRTTPIIDPVTGKQYATAALSGPADVDSAMKAAADAFDSWKHSTPSVRQKAINDIADAMEANMTELIEAEIENTGKPRAITFGEEVPPMMDQIRFFAGAARMLEGKSAGEYMTNFTSYIRREPIGVCAQVAPWNYPLMMGVWKFIPAIAAGNTTVLKPSDTTPASTALIAKIAGEVLPPGVLNVICGDRDTGRSMVTHDTPGMVSITGSVRAGMEVAGEAAKSLKRVHLELGGKAPVIIFDDADLDAAIPVVVNAIVQNSGQTCSAGSRVLIQQGIYEPLLKRLGEAFGRLQVGSAAMNLDLGPLIRASQLERVTGFLDQAKADGIATVAQGQIAVGVPAGGFYQTPTLLRDVPVMHRLAQEEVFGPVLSAMSFTDEDHAVELANATEFGLVAGIWTRDGGRQFRMAKRVRSGQVFINNYGAGGGVELPFGGVKSSGYGREKGFEALLGFTTLKTVAIQHG